MSNDAVNLGPSKDVQLATQALVDGRDVTQNAVLRLQQSLAPLSAAPSGLADAVRNIIDQLTGIHGDMQQFCGWVADFCNAMSRYPKGDPDEDAVRVDFQTWCAERANVGEALSIKGKALSSVVRQVSTNVNALIGNINTELNTLDAEQTALAADRTAAASKLREIQEYADPNSLKWLTDPIGTSKEAIAALNGKLRAEIEEDANRLMSDGRQIEMDARLRESLRQALAPLMSAADALSNLGPAWWGIAISFRNTAQHILSLPKRDPTLQSSYLESTFQSWESGVLNRLQKSS